MAESISERHEREFGGCPHWRTKLVEWSHAPYCVDCGKLVCHGICIEKCWLVEKGEGWEMG